jgi:uncharacterized protein (UPF0548 family)
MLARRSSGVISVRRPSPTEVEAYRQARVGVDPTARTASDPPPGFHHDRFARPLGSGPATFARARQGIERWVPHRGAGVEVEPHEAAPSEGATVAILTQQLGLWVLGACRVEEVVDAPDRFGFTYATLPDHPECGYESFTVVDAGHEVRFEIEAVSRPGIALVRLATPITRQLQRRAVGRYLDALARWVDEAPGSGGSV